MGLGGLDYFLKQDPFKWFLGFVFAVAVIFLFNFPMLWIPSGFFLVGHWAFQRRRFIQDTPTSKIRSAAMGWVELNGKLVSLKEGQDPCAIHVQPMGHWPFSIGDGGFGIQDETGIAAVLVDPVSASLAQLCKTILLESAQSIPAHHMALLKKHAIDLENWNYPSTLTEYRMNLHQTLHAMGVAVPLNPALRKKFGIDSPEIRFALVAGDPPGFLLTGVLKKILRLFFKKTNHYGKRAGEFIWVSFQSEEILIAKYTWMGWGCFLGLGITAIFFLGLIGH